MNPTSVLRLPRGGLLVVAALILAVAALAAVLGGGGDVQADVTGGDFVLTDTNAGANQSIGGQVSFTLTGGPLTGPVVGDLVVTVKLDNGDLAGTNLPDVGKIHNINPAANCAVTSSGTGTSGTTEDILTCTFPGPHAAGATFTVTFDAYAMGDGLHLPDSDGDPFAFYGGSVIEAKDTASAQAAQAGTDNTAGFIILAPAWDACETAGNCNFPDTVNMGKYPSVDPAYETQPFNYQIFVDNDAFFGQEDFTVTDTIPAEYLITATPTITPSTYGDFGATQSCAAPVLQVITCTGLDVGFDVGPDTALAADFDALIINVPVVPRPDSGTFASGTAVTSNAIPNTAVITCDGDGNFGANATASCDATALTVKVTDTYDVLGSTQIDRVILTPTGAPAANGTDTCTVTTSNWDVAELVGSPSGDSGAPAGDWTVTGTATGVVKTAGTDVSQQTLVLTATGAGTAIVALHWDDKNAPAALGASNTTPTVTCTFGAGPFDVEAFLGQPAGGAIRHVDVDPATEDAAGGPAGTNCVTNGGPVRCGILDGLVDPDQATSSLHTVCLFANGFNGVGAFGPDAWVINATAGSPTVDNKAEVSIDFDFDDDGVVDYTASCVQWRSAGTGSQSIHLDLALGLGRGTDKFYFDGVNGNQPLVKEWNTIDKTTIVSVSGNVGDTLTANTGELKNWTSGSDCVRDDNFSTADVNCVDRPNLDGTTQTVSGAIILDPTGIPFVNAAGLSFIDYTLGQHTDYKGPIDGARQTYTVGGDCGSVRMEDPVTGDVIILGQAPDAGTSLFAFLAAEKHDETVNANGVFDDGENIYKDADADNTVSIGDTRLLADTGAASAFANGSVVAAGDADIGTALVAFVALEKHTGAVTAYAAGNAIYNDNDGSGKVSAGDERLTRVGAFGPGSIVGSASATVPSSDKGVGLEFLPNRVGALVTTTANANCPSGSQVTLSITTEEDVQLGSDLDNACTDAAGNALPPVTTTGSTPPASQCPETITVTFQGGPPQGTTPILAWAGQRVVLEHDWSQGGTCPNYDDGFGSRADQFGVLYSRQTGPGTFTSALAGNTADNDIDATSHDAIVEVDLAAADKNADGITDPNTACISRLIYQSDEQGRVIITANATDDDDDLNQADFRSQQVTFIVYFMNFEDLKLGLVPGTRAGHNAGAFTATSGNAFDPATDVTSIDPDVSADVLVRARVRGWTLPDPVGQCPTRDAATDSNGNFLPANRCIFPDDWRHTAGSHAEDQAPQWDIMTGPGETTLAQASSCQGVGSGAAGPFSLLDGTMLSLTGNPQVPAASGALCKDSNAPHANVDNVDSAKGAACRNAAIKPNLCRETVFPNGAINAIDAPMPPAPVKFQLVKNADGTPSSGFLHSANKGDVYAPSSNNFYVTHIPAERWITKINNDGTGFLWDSWNGGPKGGVYTFWYAAANGPAVTSCPGAAGCTTGGVATGGWQWLTAYTDNHGEAMTWVNGDANLTFADCASTANGAGNNVILLSGFFCSTGANPVVVGNSSISASVDYPDFTHVGLGLETDPAHPVTVEWTWGGLKTVTLEPHETGNAQLTYVVLHVTDRDGFCGGSTSLHPVLGEDVEFHVDTGDGILAAEANGVIAADRMSASAVLFDTADPANAGIVKATQVAGECQAWALVSSSQLKPVNVQVTAHDPEGTPVFDVITNQIGPLMGDVDCDGDVDSVDALGVLRYVAGLPVQQTGPCHNIGGTVNINGTDEKFGDMQCDGDVDAVDGLGILRFVAALPPLVQTEPCADIGSQITITAPVPPTPAPTPSPSPSPSPAP